MESKDVRVIQLNFMVAEGYRDRFVLLERDFRCEIEACGGVNAVKYREEGVPSWDDRGFRLDWFQEVMERIRFENEG
jgi:hypothetical protein